MENTTFSLPEGSQNEAKNDAKRGTPKRTPKTTKQALKVTPKGYPLASVSPLRRGTKKTPRKKTLKKKPVLARNGKRANK